MSKKSIYKHVLDLMHTYQDKKIDAITDFLVTQIRMYAPNKKDLRKIHIEFKLQKGVYKNQFSIHTKKFDKENIKKDHCTTMLEELVDGDYEDHKDKKFKEIINDGDYIFTVEYLSDMVEVISHIQYKLNKYGVCLTAPKFNGTKYYGLSTTDIWVNERRKW